MTQRMSLSTRRPGLSCVLWSGCLKTCEWVHHILDDRLDSLWATQVQPDRPLLGLEDQCKREKGAASTLEGDKLHQPVRPGITSWKAEGIAICQFVHLLHILEKLVDLSTSRYLL